jgi:hypothetical protein
MLSSPGPGWLSTPQAPRSISIALAFAASRTRNAIAHTLGPCRRAKFCANERGSALTMKLTSPCL